MAWIFLCVAGLFEAGFALCLKQAADKPSWWLSLVTLLLITSSVAFMGLAMRDIPTTIAYPVWTGIGILGTVLVRCLIYGKVLSPIEGLGMLLILVGIGVLSRGSHS